LFELTFKAFKTNTQLKARAKWYEWKAGILENIRPDVEEVYNEVKAVSLLV
jgi:kinetochore protein Spc7/SPC105